MFNTFKVMLEITRRGVIDDSEPIPAPVGAFTTRYVVCDSQIDAIRISKSRASKEVLRNLGWNEFEIEVAEVLPVPFGERLRRGPGSGFTLYLNDHDPNSGIEDDPDVDPPP